jgi:cobalt-zinc-cadmium efflux system membrane fusion protein
MTRSARTSPPTFASAALCALALVGCNGPDGRLEGRTAASSGNDRSLAREAEAEHDHRDEGHDGAEGAHRESIRLSADELGQHGVSIAVAGPGTIDASIELSGVVRPNGDRLAHIVPRFPGIVREVRRTIGDSVKAGEVLAVVESSGSLARYELQTMIDGLVIERHLTLGEAVDADTQVFVVADLRNVWVDLSAFQKDLPRVRVGQTVRITADHFVDEKSKVEAKITYVTPVVDEATRTTIVRALLPNPTGSWRPGMFVTGALLDPSAVAVAVPEAALQTINGRPTVFVATDEGFEPRPVGIGRRGETLAEIVSGLKAGERYAVAGTFLLKAELGKGEDEHAH